MAISVSTAKEKNKDGKADAAVLKLQTTRILIVVAMMADQQSKNKKRASDDTWKGID